MGRYDEAEKVLRANHRTKESVLGATHADTCFAMLNLVAVWVDGEPGGRHEEAEGMARAAVAALRSSLGEEHPSVLSAQVHVGMVLAASGRAEEAVELLRKVHAAQLTAHHGEESHPDALETAWRLGCALLAPNPSPSPSPNPNPNHNPDPDPNPNPSQVHCSPPRLLRPRLPPLCLLRLGRRKRSRDSG